MIDISDSSAKKTVTFDQPLSGRQIIEAVRAACGSSYAEQQRYDDGELFLVGQSSRNLDHNVLVTPTKNDAYLSPDAKYTSVVVVHHEALAPAMPHSVNPRVDAQIQAVLNFAAKLPNFLPGAEQQAGPGLARDPYAPAAGATRHADTAQSRPRYDTPAASERHTGARDPWS